MNNTTAGNQMQPSIAMDEAGNFVISWTSYGQDGDRVDYGNIYARKFPATPVYDGSYGEVVPTLPSQTPPASYVPLITSVDDPTNHLVPPGTGYDGVVQIIMNGPDGPGPVRSADRGNELHPHRRACGHLRRHPT